MQARQSCYVSIPFGIKPLLDGGQLDFDQVYREVIRPAMQELGIECSRLDDYAPNSILHKTMLTAVISSDLMIADISTHNANVLYELGIRHALRRGRTLLISAGSRLPADVGYVQALFYTPDAEGRLTGEAAKQFRQSLMSVVSQSQRSVISDSPIYEFFPDLEVMLPQELEAPQRRRSARPVKSARTFVEAAVESPAAARGELEKSEAAVRGAAEPDPVGYLKVLRKYRDLSDWDRVIALADDAPPDLAASPDVRQLLALALNRRSKPGDQERAITVMEQLIAETGGDGETYGILGRIYKDRYERSKEDGDSEQAATNLNRAIEYYRAGFAKNPSDYYPGINAVNLLLQKRDPAAAVELNDLLPRVRAAVQGARADFWQLTTDMQLAAIARDWPAAENAARMAAAQGPATWMIETTLRDIYVMRRNLAGPDEQGRLDEVARILAGAIETEAAR